MENVLGWGFLLFLVLLWYTCRLAWLVVTMLFRLVLWLLYYFMEYHIYLEWCSLAFLVRHIYPFFWSSPRHIEICFWGTFSCIVTFVSNFGAGSGSSQYRIWYCFLMHPHSWCASILPQPSILSIISLTELLGCHFKHDIQFVDLVHFTFIHNYQ